jgi:hypothetical protein
LIFFLHCTFADTLMAMKEHNMDLTLHKTSKEKIHWDEIQ